MSNYKNHRWGFNFSPIGIISFLPVLFLAIWMSLAHAQASVEIDQQTEAALLAEDWPKVADLLGSVNAETPSPVARLLKGHACLALNRNNESLCLFLSVFLGDSVKTLQNFKEWDKWTENFIVKNGRNAIAYYLKGDALARLEQWGEALNSFNKALEFKSNYPLVLNARGAVYSAMGKWSEAIVDFDDAILANPSFADAYASRGSVNILTRAGADGALRRFNRALEISSDFALALNGRGCTNYAIGEWDKAQADFGNVMNHTGCLKISFSNLNLLMLAKIEHLEKEQEILAQNNPGTELNKKIIDANKWEITKLKTGIAMDIGFNAADKTVRDVFSMIKINFGINADIKQKMKDPTDITKSFGLKAGIEIDPGPVLKEGGKFMDKFFQSQMQDKYYKIQQIEIQNHKLLSGSLGMPGGVTTDMRRSFVDDGNWFVDTFYGLFYVVEPIKTLSKEMKEDKK